MQEAADRIVLIAEPGPELTMVVLILAIALIGALVGVMMARRGRIEGWSLVGLFGLVILGSALALAHMPTRLAFDRNGVELDFWGVSDRRAWPQVAGVNVRRGPLGTWVAFNQTGGAPPLSLLWSRWPGLFVPDGTIEPRQIAMRIEAWRLAVKR